MFSKLFGWGNKDQAPKAAAPAAPAAVPVPSPAPIKLDTVLMLEDEESLTEMLQVYLEDQSFRVTAVKSGVEGVKEIMKQDFDVIVCDMLMPGLPGDMFYLAVQKVKPHLCRRFIFMTGQKGDKKIDEFIRGVHGVMMWKPFHPHELLETMKFVLKKTRGG